MSSDTTINSTTESEPEIVLAIATALHLERNFAEGRQTLTFDTQRDDTLWSFTGKLQRLSSRKNIQIRSRK